MRFLIQTFPYYDRSAGICALHRLCHWLRVLGYDAVLNTDKLNPDWETATWDGIMTSDTVAIYPEITHDNPFGAPKIVRWALSYPGHHYHGSPSLLNACDLMMYYADRFRDGAKAACPTAQDVHRLFVSVYPADMFFKSVKMQKVDAYYIGRGRGTFEKFKHTVPIENAMEFPGNFNNRYEVGKWLRNVRNFYVFDQVSAIFAESALCGATPFLVREDGTVKECGPADPECMGVFGSNARFDQPGDVPSLVKLLERL